MVNLKTAARMLDDLDTFSYRFSAEEKKQLTRLRDLHESREMEDEDEEKLANLHDKYC